MILLWYSGLKIMMVSFSRATIDTGLTFILTNNIKMANITKSYITNTGIPSRNGILSN